MRLTRRTLLAATAIAPAFAAPAVLRAQTQEKLSIASHRIHQIVSTGAKGGDITKAWTERTRIGVEWITFEVGPLRERLFREASLRETSLDIGFLLNTQLTPATASLFEPLEALMQVEPVEEMGDLFPGMVEAGRIGGKLIAIPFRQTTSGLHYNEELFAERGLTRPPQTIEEFFDYAKRLTYTRADGARVVGFCIPGVNYANVVDIARAWDGDFITADYRCVANEGGMVKAILGLQDLFKAGAFPREFAAIQNEDVNTWMQQGRAAMTMTSMSRSSIYNDPQKSRFPGKMKVVAVPSSQEVQPRIPVAPVKVEFWSMALPKNSRNKPLAWSLLREMTSKRATIMAAINGNGPVRGSAYDDPALASMLPYAQAERAALKVARAPIPAFDNSQRATDIFKEEVEAALLGLKPLQKALDELTTRVQALIKI